MSATEAELVRGAHSLVVVAFPAAWLRLEVDDTDGNPQTAENLETGRQVWNREREAIAMVDGPMFTLVGGGTDYARAQGANLLYRYLDERRRVDVRSQHAQRGATLSVDAEGRAAWNQGATEVRGATFAVQGYPELLYRGENVASTTRDRQVEGRAGLGLLDDGRVCFAIGRSGMREFAEALREVRVGSARVTDAVYLDGGGSTTIALRGQGGSDLVAQGLDSRRLPVYLLAVPARGAVGTTGPEWWGAVVAAAGLALGAALGAAWLRNRRYTFRTQRGQ